MPDEMVPTSDEMVPHEDLKELDPCASCAAPLAHDQRYCLNCGRRRTGERVAYGELLAGREAGEVLVVDEVAEEPPRRRPGATLLGALSALASVVVLGLGVVIGLLLRDEEPPPRPVVQAPPQKAPVVNVTTGGGGGSAGEAVTGEEFVSDWPEGETGFTVQLETLPNTSDQAAVDAAKADAETKGAAEVGALDSDEYTSLEPGNFMIYSGVFTGKAAKKKATATLKKLKRDFPKAKVVKVSSGDQEFGVADEKPEEQVEQVDKGTLEDLENSTGAEQQKKSARLPDTIGIPGKPPPKEKPKGGGKTFE